MSIETIELNSSPSTLEIDHSQGTVSFMHGDHPLEVMSIESIVEAAELLRSRRCEY